MSLANDVSVYSHITNGITPDIAASLLSSLPNFSLNFYKKLHDYHLGTRYIEHNRYLFSQLKEEFQLALCGNSYEYAALMFGPNIPSKMRNSGRNNGNVIEDADPKLPPEYRKGRKGKPCGHVFVSGEGIYGCRNCAVDDTCVMCARCFNAESHRGHDVFFYMVEKGGGCCDCGDAEAWKIPLSCVYHSISHSEETINIQKNMIPYALQASIRTTISTLLDFVLDTFEMCYTPDEMKQPITEGYVRQLDSAETNEEIVQQKLGQLPYTLSLWNDETHSFGEVVDAISKAKSYSTADALSITQKIDVTGREVIESSSALSNLIKLTPNFTMIDLTVSIRTIRETVREYVAGTLLEYLKELPNEVVSEANVDGVHYEAVDAFIIKVVSEELQTPRRHIKQYLLRSRGLSVNSAMPRESENVYLSDIEENYTLESSAVKDWTLRVDSLLFSDFKLWKSVRNDIRSLLISTMVVSGEETKKLLGLRLVRGYPRLSYYYMLKDREPELSILNFTVQIFTVPSVAEYLVQKTNVVQFLFTILKIVSFSDTRPEYNLNNFFEAFYLAQEDSEYYGKLTCEGDTLKTTRKYLSSFHDLRHFLTTKQVKFTAIQANDSILEGFLDLCTVWQGMHPQHRYTAQHIEFESTVWRVVFQFSAYVARLVDDFAGCFHMAPDGNPANYMESVLLKSISTTINRIQSWCEKSFAEENSTGLINVQYRVAFGDVSFHNPLHWFLACLLTQLPKTLKKLKSCGITIDDQIWSKLSVATTNTEPVLSFPGFWPNAAPQKPISETFPFLSIIEHPLRVNVLLSQIRSNIWVRNGHIMRHQAFVYKDISLREVYDYDLFILQIGAIAIKNPKVYLHTLTERFDLQEWFNGRIRKAELKSGFEVSQLVQLAEDFLNLLIIIIDERSRLAAIDIHEEMREEIIHMLALKVGGIPYSFLTTQIPDRLVEWVPDPAIDTDSRTFNDILNEVATFKEPDGSSDKGLYELKDECYQSVNPWFWHYSQNQRQEVEEILKKRNEKLAKDDSVVQANQVWVKPVRKLDLGAGFETLNDLVHCEEFVAVIFFALWNVSRSMLTPKKVRPAKQTLPYNYPEEHDIMTGVRGDTVFAEAIQLVILALEIQRSDMEENRVEFGKPDSKNFVSIAGNFTFTLNRRVPPSMIIQGADNQMFDDLSTSYLQCEMTLLDLLLELADHSSEELVKDQALRLRWIAQEFEKLGDEETNKTCADWRTSNILSTSQDATMAGDDADVDKMTEKERKKLAAKKRKEAILEQMAAQQQSFIQNHEEDVKEANTESDKMEADLNESLWEYPSGTCIVCQESTSTELYGMLASVQPSHFLRYVDTSDSAAVESALSTPTSLDVLIDRQDTKSSTLSNDTVDLTPINNKLFIPGLHISSCGHLIHARCFESFTVSIQHRHRTQSTRNHPETLSMKEFLCPFCKSLGNCLIPIVWDSVVEQKEVSSLSNSLDEDGFSFSEWWKRGVGEFASNSVLEFCKNRVLSDSLTGKSGTQDMSRKIQPRRFSTQWKEDELMMDSDEDDDDDDDDEDDEEGTNETELPNFRNFSILLSDEDENRAISLISGSLHSKEEVAPRKSKIASGKSSLKSEPSFYFPSRVFSTISLDNLKINLRELSHCYRLRFEDTVRIISSQAYENISTVNVIDYMLEMFSYTVACVEAAGRGDVSINSTSESLNVLNSLSLQTTTLLRVLSRSILTQTAVRVHPNIDIDVGRKKLELQLRGRKCDYLRSLFFGFVEQPTATIQLLDTVEKNGKVDFNVILQNYIKGEDHDFVPVLKQDSFAGLVEAMFTVVPPDFGYTEEMNRGNGSQDVLQWMSMFYVLEIVKVVVSVVENDVAGFNGYKEQIVVEAAAKRVGSNGGDEMEVDVKGKKPIRGSMDEFDQSTGQIMLFVRWILHVLGFTATNAAAVLGRIDTKVILAFSQTMLLPFMRKSVILLHSRFNHAVEIPDEFTETEFERLRKYLRLPKMEYVLSNKTITDSFLSRLIAGWCLNLSLNEPRVFNISISTAISPLDNLPATMVRAVPPENEDSSPMISYIPRTNLSSRKLFPFLSKSSSFESLDGLSTVIKFQTPGIYELFKLPYRLDLLSAKRSCVNECTKGSLALCLVCGTLVCVQCDICATGALGECNSHSITCTGNIGMFLHIKACVLMYLHNNRKGCFPPAPYLDAHGETDSQLKRRRPMFLSKKRYDDIRKLWLNHSVSSSVARSIESTLDQGGWRTM